MYEYLKILFGKNDDGTPASLTFEQLVEKLEAEKSIKIVNLEDGGYVSKDKLDAKITELSGLRQQLDAANATIKSYTDMDIDGIKKSVTDWEKKYNDDTAALNQKIADNERAYQEELFLRGYKFSSKAAAEGIRAEFVKRKFPYEDGSFIGGKEFMEKLMGDEDYKAAFVSEEPKSEPAPAPTPAQAPKPQFSDPSPRQTQPKIKLSLAELMKRKNENPNAEIKFD